MRNRIGKLNISVGLLVMAAFMAYGFWLIYMRDFHPNKEAWIAASDMGKHFESRIAHVHGNLFSIINIIYGYLILTLPIPSGYAKLASIFALGGLLMPLGILAEAHFGAPYYLVLVGAISIILATLTLAIGVLRLEE
ncbi:MAG: hypothetical protein GXN91_03995 [Epsilonproteobacteria bacterium]|nr:hypothetical protein [Campylobacterota bacterium]